MERGVRTVNPRLGHRRVRIPSTVQQHYEVFLHAPSVPSSRAADDRRGATCSKGGAKGERR
jgi:hypothetical protein